VFFAVDTLKDLVIIPPLWLTVQSIGAVRDVMLLLSSSFVFSVGDEMGTGDFFTQKRTGHEYTRKMPVLGCRLKIEAVKPPPPRKFMKIAKL